MRHLGTIAAGIVTAVFVWVAPAHPQSAPPDAIAAARELIRAAQAADQVKMLLPLLEQQMKPLIVQGRPEVERDYDKIMPMMREAIDQQVGALIDEFAMVYARNFTVDEMRQVTAFYRTPVGQKLLEKTPLIAQESMTIGQRFGQKIGQELQMRMKEELRKRGHNI